MWGGVSYSTVTATATAIFCFILLVILLLIPWKKLFSGNQSKVKQFQRDISSAIAAKQYAKLGLLFHHGVPDTISPNGEITKGYKPEPEKALRYYKQAIYQGQYKYLLNIGQIYHHGLLAFPANPRKAKEAYELLQQIGTPHQQIMARDRLRDLQRDHPEIFLLGDTPNPRQDPFPFTPPGFPQDLFLTLEPVMRVMRNRRGGEIVEGRMLVQTRAPLDDRNFFLDITLPLHAQDNENEDENGVDDSQVVHDSTVVKSVTQALNKVKDKVKNPISVDNTVSGIYSVIDACKTNETVKKHARATLYTMIATNTLILASGLTEVEILQLAWSHLQSFDTPTRKQLEENLVHALADSVEHELVTCATGRISRIIDIFTTIDPEVQIKSETTIHQEILFKASKIREEMIKKYGGGDDVPDEKQTEFEQNLKQRIKQSAYDDFVATGLMSQDRLDNELNQWLDSI